MARTALLYILPAFLVATFWARLEQGGGAEGGFLWLAALALAPALVRPLWLRAAALLVVSALAVRAAFHLSILDARPFRDEDFFGPFGSRLWKGFAAFFDVELPFRATDHPSMHGAILLAVFAFCVVLGLAIATRRPLLASAVLVAGAGWPATIMSGDGDLARGAVVLAAALLLFAGMRSLPTLDVRQPLLAGAGVVLVAVVLSTSPSVARGEFVQGWRDWDVRGLVEPSLGVDYVWNSNYAGIRFPEKPTTVLTIDAPENARVYWRATTLDSFARGLWVEQLFGGADPEPGDGPDVLTADPFLPDAARDPDNWIEARVEVEALRDNHLVGASVPVAYDVGDRDVSYKLSNVAIVEGGTDRGDSYTVWSYAAEPTPSELARLRGSYPEYLQPELYRSLDGVTMPAFGSPGRERELQEILDRDPRLGEYAGVYRQARDIVGSPRSPYAAVVALETWFRSGGDFVYDEQPPRAAGTPPLVSFVTETKRGYCQHFAGAMALMLRQLGIPARVAAGFTSGRYDRDDGHWVVADRNAHTWVEVWFQGFGWLPFDPTPGRGALGASYTASSFRFDVGGAQAAIGAAGFGLSDLLRGETGGPDRPRGADPGAEQPASSGGGAENRGTGIVALLLAIGLAAAALLTAAKLARRGVRFLNRDPRGVAGACRRDLVGFMADQGVRVPESATPTELGQTLERQFGVDPVPLIEAVTLARFGPPEGAADAANRSRRELRRVRRALRARLSVPRRARGLVSLRSLAV
jgi:transglutaminase-like putative cysteine protease